MKYHIILTISLILTAYIVIWLKYLLRRKSQNNKEIFIKRPYVPPKSHRDQNSTSFFSIKKVKSSLPSRSKDVAKIKKNRRMVDSVIIDDDYFVNEAILKYSSREFNRKYDFYTTPEEFAKNIESYSLTVPLYIDSRLGNKVKGEIISKVFYDYGFNEIYLFTNSDVEQLSLEKSYWLKGIVKKDQIWRSN